MKKIRLTVTALLLFICQAGEAQLVKSIIKLILGEAAETSSTKVLSNSAKSYLEYNTAKTFSRSLGGSLDETLAFSRSNIPRYRKYTTSASTALTTSEQNSLSKYLNYNPSEWERLSKMSSEEFKNFARELEPQYKITTSTVNAKIITKKEDYLLSEPALEYSELTVEIQKELQKRGYKIKADGRFGNQTKVAAARALMLKSLQKMKHQDALKVARNTLFESYGSKLISVEKGPIVSSLEFTQGNSLMISTKIHHDNPKEVEKIGDFYQHFFSKFEGNDEKFMGTRFLTVYKTESDTYLGLHFKNPAEKGIRGALFDFGKAKPETRKSYADLFFNRSDINKVYVYGDDLGEVEKFIEQHSAGKNIRVIYRNTNFTLTFNQAEASIKKLANARINPSRLSFMNGIPGSEQEALFQSFRSVEADNLKSLRSDLNNVVLAKPVKVIDSKEALIKELTNGDNDFLLLAAHSDGEYLYFGSSSISLAELKALTAGVKRKNARVAVLFSCLTGDIYKPVFSNDPKAVAEALINNGCFDFVIAPTGTLNGEEVLKMLQMMYNYPVLDLHKYFNKQLKEGKMRNIAMNTLFFNNDVSLTRVEK